MHPLQQHPFRPIPGVNPELPINQQMEQIEQLNTLLLQEIDANFAKFHQIITSRILPQIKRYAIAAEPAREGAKVLSLVDRVLTSSSGRHSTKPPPTCTSRSLRTTRWLLPSPKSHPSASTMPHPLHLFMLDSTTTACQTRSHHRLTL